MLSLMETGDKPVLTPPIQNQPTTTAIQKSKNTRLLAVVLAIIIVLVLIGYYFWTLATNSTIANPTNSYQQNTNNADDIAPSENVPTSTPAPPLIDTSTWKTYSVSKYSFSFKYPPEYIINSKQNDLVINESQEEKIKYEECLNSNPVDEWCLQGVFINLEYINKQIDQNLSDLSENLLKKLLQPEGEITYIIVDNKPALQYIFRGKDTQYDIFIDEGNSILHIKAIPSNEDVFKEIVNSIKLLQ